MQKKLQLDVTQLKVEGFAVTGLTSPDVGTVAAHTGKMSVCQHVCIPEEETANNPTAAATCPSCYQTCYTCAGDSCQYTCDVERLTCGYYNCM